VHRAHKKFRSSVLISSLLGDPVSTGVTHVLASSAEIETNLKDSFFSFVTSVAFNQLQAVYLCK